MNLLELEMLIATSGMPADETLLRERTPQAQTEGVNVDSGSSRHSGPAGDRPTGIPQRAGNLSVAAQRGHGVVGGLDDGGRDVPVRHD